MILEKSLQATGPVVDGVMADNKTLDWIMADTIRLDEAKRDVVEMFYTKPSPHPRRRLKAQPLVNSSHGEDA